MMSNFCKLTSPNFSLKGKALLIPVVSAANVGQLAVDLVIATWSLRRIGIFDSRDLIPVAGAREDGEDGITVPLELYGRDDLDFVAIQQRSPALKTSKQSFVDSILGFAHHSQIGSILFLSGMDLINRTDSQMLTPTLHIIPKNSPPLTSSPLSKINDLPIPAYGASLADSDISHDASLKSKVHATPFIPSGGLTRRFLDTLSVSWSIPTACLLQFVMEGDNRADAQLLATVASKVLGLELGGDGWKQPKSWDVGLFGSDHDQTLYG